MNNAVRNKIAWSKSNTCTTFDSTIENCFVYLHGNHIATYNYANKELSLYDGGWQFNTTRADLMRYVMSWRLVLEYFKKTGNGSLVITQTRQLKILQMV